jgi:hypothetical protein
MLHVTNGDCTTELLARTGLGGDLLSWLDVLHDGPVPDGPPEALRAARATFLAQEGWTSRDEALVRLRARDERLARALAQGEPVVLWFEHDLFDQLQLLQVLDAVGDQDAGRVELILVGSFPGRTRFAGLGELTPPELASLWPERAPLRPEQRARARRAWAGFRAGDLDALAAEARAPADGLPHLGAALERLLQEVPGRDGLGRTERELLAAVGRGAATAGAAFAAAARREEAPFLGDASAFSRLAALAAAPGALIDAGEGPVRAQTPVRLTSRGRAVLAGREAWSRPEGRGRWLGGARLDPGASGNAANA